MSDQLPDEPHLSLVVPCYNEERCLDATIPPLVEAFTNAGVVVQMVLVDNGSTDRTSAVIDSLIHRGLPIVKGTVPVNRGQGLGYLTGFQQASGHHIGWICADGQVAPEDVVAVYQKLSEATVPSLAKVRRRYRQDNWKRRIISIVYNGMFQVIFLGIHSLDINGNPKMMPARMLRLMELSSEDWFLEAEAMLKADHLKLPIIEINVMGLARESGQSHVQFSAIPEFLWNILRFRLGKPWRLWRRSVSSKHVLDHPAVSNR